MTPCSPSEAITPFLESLDISGLKNQSQILNRFSEIAAALIHNFSLSVEYDRTLTEFELLEIEFYLYKTEVHEDPFCHAHDDQRKSAQWYFHRAPRSVASSARPCSQSTYPSGYRGGTRKGLDLTFGTPVISPFFPMSQEGSRHIQGGILLRSMRPLDGSGSASLGPSLLVDKILSITDSRNTAELVDTKLGGCISILPPAENPKNSSQLARLYLAPRRRISGSALPLLHRSPRVGLDLANPSVTPHQNNPRVIYISKLYRYFVRPELLRTNGRCHTLIGLLLVELPEESSTVQSLHDPRLVDRLMDLTALKRATLVKYIENYTRGLTTRSLADYVGPLGKGASSNPQKFMRMMGILRRMGLLTTSG